MATETTLNKIVKKDANREVIVSSKGMSKLSLISFVEGFRNKPSFGLRAWNHLILTLDGRDKVTKLLQYVCRLMAWWFQQPKIPTDSKRYVISQLSTFFTAERFAALKNSLATSRKAFRLGRSMVEIQKLQSLGIWQVMDVYLNRLLLNVTDDVSKEIHPFTMNAVSKTPKDCRNIPLWNIAGNSIKSLGLFIFWAADNMTFLLQSGFLDDYQTNANDRLYQRSRQIVKATNIANRSYFVAAIAGLLTNWTLYWNYTNTNIVELKDNVIRSQSNDEMYEEAKKIMQNAQEKQFTLFVALVKSVCDVILFSNNAGMDLWTRYCHRPLHEGIHCLCGIISAAVVLYNNYPNMSDLE